jgi:FKBP-type peptidyl-prolyl cis-trans isomerase
MMPAGSTWELYIPYNLAYGERGNQNIPPYSTLIFKVQVIAVK